MKVAKKVEELIDSSGKKKFLNPDGNWVDGSFDIKEDQWSGAHSMESIILSLDYLVEII